VDASFSQGLAKKQMYCPHISILCLEAQGNKAALTQTLLHRVANKTFHLFQF